MSEENKNLEDKAKEALENVKEEVQDFTKETEKTVNEFTDGLKQTTSGQENKKVIAGILALLLGCFGVHKFILGYSKEGIIQIILTIVTCGIASIVPFVEGIIYLTKSDEEFYETYQVNKKAWF